MESLYRCFLLLTNSLEPSLKAKCLRAQGNFSDADELYDDAKYGSVTDRKRKREEALKEEKASPAVSLINVQLSNSFLEKAKSESTRKN